MTARPRLESWNTSFSRCSIRALLKQILKASQVLEKFLNDSKAVGQLACSVAKALAPSDADSELKIMSFFILPCPRRHGNMKFDTPIVVGLDPHSLDTYLLHHVLCKEHEDHGVETFFTGGVKSPDRLFRHSRCFLDSPLCHNVNMDALMDMIAKFMMPLFIVPTILPLMFVKT
eukprot:2581135-Amphidinium_carterae.3